MAQDYYQTLGLQRGASADEISKAYREMARKHHPDLNPDDEAAKQKFQDVQLAFEVLGDQKKREMYDRYGPGFENMSGGPGGAGGPGGWPGGGPAAGGQPFDFDLSDLFGGGGAAGGGGFADLFKQRGRAAKASRGADLAHEITIPFATAISGGEAAINIRRADGADEQITVKIPAGIESGKKIRLRGQGQPKSPREARMATCCSPSTWRPTLASPVVARDSDVTAPITLSEAMLGCKIDVPTPTGTVTVSVPPGTSSGKRLRVKGHGVQPAGKSAGDLYVELQIVLPETMPESERQQIAEIIGPQPEHPRALLRW